MCQNLLSSCWWELNVTASIPEVESVMAGKMIWTFSCTKQVKTMIFIILNRSSDRQTMNWHFLTFVSYVLISSTLLTRLSTALVEDLPYPSDVQLTLKFIREIICNSQETIRTFAETILKGSYPADKAKKLARATVSQRDIQVGYYRFCFFF